MSEPDPPSPDDRCPTEPPDVDSVQDELRLLCADSECCFDVVEDIDGGGCGLRRVGIIACGGWEEAGSGEFCGRKVDICSSRSFACCRCLEL